MKIPKKKSAKREFNYQKKNKEKNKKYQKV